MNKRGGLGRGLAALIPTSAPPVEQPQLPVEDPAGPAEPSPVWGAG